MTHSVLFPRMLLTSVLLGLMCACSVPENEPLQQWEHAEAGAYAADISASGKIAVVAGMNNSINVWRTGQPEPVYQWSHQGEAATLVGNIHIAADDTTVVTADRDAFALWSMANGDPVGFWRIDESSIRDVAVANQGQGVLVGRGNGKVMYFEPATGRRMEFLGHQSKVNSVDISPNGKYALTGGNDYVAYLWSTETGQIIHTFNHPSRVTLVAVDDKGRYAFTADSQQKSQIWNLQTGAPVSNLQYIARQKIFTDAVFSDDGQYLLTGSPARRIYLWEVSSGEQIGEWAVSPREGASMPSALVYAVAFVNNNTVLSESSSGFAELWKIEYE